MAKKHKPNNKMKGNTDMHSEEPEIIADDFVEVATPAPVSASEPKVEAPAPVAPAPTPEPEAVQDNGKLVNVDMFGNTRHIAIPNVK